MHDREDATTFGSVQFGRVDMKTVNDCSGLTPGFLMGFCGFVRESSELMSLSHSRICYEEVSLLGLSLCESGTLACHIKGFAPLL